MKHIKHSVRRLTGSELGKTVLRSLLVVFALAVEATWIVALIIAAAKLYNWIT